MDAIQDQLAVENHCYGCGPHNPDGLQIKSYWDGDETICTFTPRAAHTAGPRHVLNGGVIATIIDCHCICTAIAAVQRAENRPFHSEPHIWCVTASLHIDYLKPTPIEGPVILRARIAGIEGKKIAVTCTLLADGVERARANVLAVRVASSWRGA